MHNLLGILFSLLLIAISGHIIWRSTDGFETAADYLGRKMSRGVKGATINAVASSMPEFLTTMFFLFYIKNNDVFVDSFSGGLGVVAGSAVFNILVIPMAVILFGGVLISGKFNLDRKVVARDGLFLIFSNIFLIIIVAQDEIKTWHGAVLVLIYFIYMVLLRKGLGINSDFKEDPERYRIIKQRIGFRNILFLDIPRLLLNGKKLNRANAWVVLILSTAVMSIGTWLLVEGTKLLGEGSGEGTVLANLIGLKDFDGLGIPIVFLSVLLAAAATSIPDTMISVRDARKGNHDDSISNAIGSNIFDISFAIGFPLMLYTLFYGDFSLSPEVQVYSFGILIAMWLINIFTVFLFMVSNISLRLKAGLLLLIYILFIVYIFLEHKEATLSSFFKEWIQLLKL
ncbi:sodium:calcium antiporter [Bacteroidota bacterium]